jgi:hypothetical protein
MRTERPQPWGFDVWDPRLTMRQQAADAQHKADGELREVDEPADRNDSPVETRELETVGGGLAK